MNLVVHIDGGARGNPGPAGAGVVVTHEDGTLLHESAHFLGTQTNNAAEYHALIRGLQRSAKFKPAQLQIRSDSELLVRQITGEYRVRNAGLVPLFEQSQLLLVKTARWQIKHVRREQNRRADELANIAMDQRRDVLVFDADAAPEELSPQVSGSSPHGQAEYRLSVPPGVPPGAPPGQPPTASAGEPEIAPANVSDSQAAANAAAQNASPAHAMRVRITLAQSPAADQCPSGAPFVGEAYEIGTSMPAGLCVHAAHAVLPTVLAIVNAAAEEVSAIPVMTVRCSKRECRGAFHVGPAQMENGHAK